MNLLETLANRVGVRTAGSPQSAEAAAAIAEGFRELGLRTIIQEFPLLGYEAEEPELEIEGERWAAGPCLYAHPTPEAGVEGRVRRIGEQPRMLSEQTAPVFAVEDDAGRELGRIYANPVIGGAIPFLSLQHLQINVGPAVFVSVEDGERLATLEGAPARLVARGRFVPGQSDCNVLAELPGESDEQVVVSAHFDSVWQGCGAIDNATGVEGVRRLAERLIAAPKPARTVLFAAFGAEEPGLIGSRYFVHEAALRGRLNRIVGVVNLDCIGHGETFMLMVGPDELRGRALEQVRSLGLDDRYRLEVMDPGPGTDHYWFSQHDIPAISILHFPYPEYHLPDECLELVDERRMDDAVELAAALVESQLARPVPRT